MRILYVCYLSVLEALTESQVIPYLTLLVRHGTEVHILTFERSRQGTREALAARAAALGASGIRLHTLPYHKRPSLPATAYDVLRGVLHGWHIVRTHDIDVVHARSHVPAAMALALFPMHGCAGLFARVVRETLEV